LSSPAATISERVASVPLVWCCDQWRWTRPHRQDRRDRKHDLKTKAAGSSEVRVYS